MLSSSAPSLEDGPPRGGSCYYPIYVLVNTLNRKWTEETDFTLLLFHYLDQEPIWSNKPIITLHFGRVAGVRARLGVEGRIYIFTDAGGSSQLSDFGQICNGFFSKVAPLYFVLVRSSMTV